jgi:glycosyltransferase involved in cell wall biosynthesis
MTPYFSVIITIYNRAEMFRTALKSLERQTFTDYEVFVIDDFSSDNTQLVIDKFRHHANWNFIALKENHGYPYCKNLVLDKAKGRYVTFLDSDDAWLPERLAEFHLYTGKNSGAGFIFSDGYIHQDGRIISKIVPDSLKVPEGKLPAYMAVSDIWLPYVTTNVAIRSDSVQKSGKYLEDMIYLGDTEYFARILKNYPAGYINKPLSVYRIHSVSITKNWEACISESLKTLEIAGTPDKEYHMLTDYIYLTNSVILLKNGYRAKAREMLGKIKNYSLKISLIYILTFVPGGLIDTARIIFKKLRLAKVQYAESSQYAKVDGYLTGLEKTDE